MARRRFIHPDFFHDEALVTLPPFTRLLFAGLWCLADREGRLADKPRKIKMQLFPADQVDVDAALMDLASRGMVTRYAVNGEMFLQVNKFHVFQSPHPREARSIIPGPGAPRATPGLTPGTAKVDPEPRQGDAEQSGYSGPSDTRDLRSVSPPAPALSGRPAGPRDVASRGKPLAYKPRIDVAWPGRPPVPGSLHAEFINKLGGDEADARSTLEAWYPVAADAWQSVPIGDDDFAFWRARFREWVGTTRQPARSSASPLPTSYDEWCTHEPRCNSREWHAVLVARAVAGETEAVG